MWKLEWSNENLIIIEWRMTGDQGNDVTHRSEQQLKQERLAMCLVKLMTTCRCCLYFDLKLMMPCLDSSQKMSPEKTQ